MPQHKFATGKYTKAICDICGLEYPLLQLRLEPLSAYGAPTNATSNLKACPKCWDPPQPLSFLPIAVQQHGYDPEQVRGPRPDIFPKAYPVNYTTKQQIYQNNAGNLIQLPQGFTGTIYANGIYSGYSVSIPNPPSGFTINSVTLMSPQRAAVNLSISPSAVIDTYEMAIVDQSGQALNGQIVII